eukprot:5219294-Prymnesium_polylepis.1
MSAAARMPVPLTRAAFTAKRAAREAKVQYRARVHREQLARLRRKVEDRASAQRRRPLMRQVEDVAYVRTVPGNLLDEVRSVAERLDQTQQRPARLRLILHVQLRREDRA